MASDVIREIFLLKLKTSYRQISRIPEAWGNKFTFTGLWKISQAGTCEPPPNAQQNYCTGSWSMGLWIVTITRTTNVVAWSKAFAMVQSRPIPQEAFINLLRNIRSNITFSKLLPHFTESLWVKSRDYYDVWRGTGRHCTILRAVALMHILYPVLILIQ